MNFEWLRTNAGSIAVVLTIVGGVWHIRSAMADLEVKQFERFDSFKTELRMDMNGIEAEISGLSERIGRLEGRFEERYRTAPTEPAGVTAPADTMRHTPAYVHLNPIPAD